MTWRGRKARGAAPGPRWGQGTPDPFWPEGVWGPLTPAGPRQSPGLPTRQAGFTLIEITIVLVVLGLVAALVVSRGPVRSPTVDLRSAATVLLQGLRAARAEAIAADAPRTLSLDPVGHAYRIGAASPQPLPPSIAVILAVAGRPARAITFQPDGSSTGGVLDLASSTGRLRLTVDWLSGRMRIATPPVS